MDPTALWPSFETSPEPKALLFLVAVVFVSLFILESAFYHIFSLGSSGEILGPQRNRVILGRRCTEALSMGVAAVVGFQLQNELGWGEAFTEGAGTDALARTGRYHGGATRLAALQLAYQCFNVVTSLRDSDGALFVAHHIVAGSLCFFVLDSFCCIYSPFFFGVTEVSTTVLCLLASFDDALGIPALSARFPSAKILLGGLFAALFVWCRIYAWSFMSAAFWQDMLTLIADPSTAGKVFHGLVPQSAFIVYFLACNAGLSVLQVFWLGEIVTTAHKLLLGGGSGGGGDETKQKGQ